LAKRFTIAVDTSGFFTFKVLATNLEETEAHAIALEVRRALPWSRCVAFEQSEEN
jgi:hypothetical protein